MAWLIAAACLAVMLFRARRIALLERPSVAAVLERLESGFAESRVAQREELDELLREVERATRLGVELPRALARVALASGTALALLGWIGHPAAPAWVPVLAAFFAGWIGAVGIAWVGRATDRRARAAREHWRDLVRRVRVRLATGERAASWPM